MILGCYYNKVYDTVISDSSFIVDSKGIEFTCDSPLMRKCNSGSVGIEVSDYWKPVPPWTSIELRDGSLSKINVILTSEDGKTFTSNIIGSAGGMIDARFEPEIPKNVMIKVVKVTSEIQLSCRKIVWHDYNAT